MRAAARRGDMNALARARHRLPPADRRGGGERRPRAVLEVARRRGADHDLAVRHVRRAGGGRRAPRADPRGDPLRQPAAAAGREARKHVEAVRPHRAEPGQRPRAPAEPTGAVGRRGARRAVPRGARAAPADRRRRPADRRRSRTTSTRRTRSSGLLGTIPVLCMGLFAPVAAYLAARLGTRRAMTIGLALIGVFGVLRAIVPSAWLVVLLTWPVGIGMGLGNALAPLAVRETVPERPATGTGVYTTGIQIGSTAAAALAVPLAAVLGGWRGALIALLGASRCVLADRVGRARARRGAARAAAGASSRGSPGARGRPGCSSRSSPRWRRRTTASTRGSPTRTASAAGATSRPACSSPR